MIEGKPRLYLEMHITVEPHPASKFEEFRSLAAGGGWAASLFDQDDVDRYHNKWFMSARETSDEASAKVRLRNTLEHLRLAGYKVIRWKIEDTLLDSKYGDEL